MTVTDTGMAYLKMFAMFMKGGFIAMAVPSSVFTTVEFKITHVSVFRTASLASSPFVPQVGWRRAQFPLLLVGAWACVGRMVTFLSCS